MVMGDPTLPCPLQNFTLVGEMEVKLRDLVGEVKEGIHQEVK